ncbi:hypothetical protein KDA14_00695 [Candidatus Saccharibacteria bacterium]|nr:hypothetical protein [Candidatus Saccharibacteria bacterium]
MKRFKKLVFVLLALMVVAGFLSVFMKSRQYGFAVPKGFAFGAPNNQARMDVEGEYSVTWYGSPAPYKVTETFRPTGDVFNTLSYDEMPLHRFAIVTNFIFWMGLFVAFLAPITIFWRPQNKPSESTPPEEKQKTNKTEKTSENTRD